MFTSPSVSTINFLHKVNKLDLLAHGVMFPEREKNTAMALSLADSDLFTVSKRSTLERSSLPRYVSRLVL